MIQTEVIIIGAGPTGLSLAAQCLRFGIDFVICDQKSGPTDLSKALIVHARTLEIYDQMNLAAPAIAAGEDIRQWAMMHKGKVAAHLNFENIGAGQSRFPFVLVFEQSKNEYLLNDYLQRAGKTVLWQHALQNLSQDSQGVIVSLRDANGEQQEIKGAYLVGCDGASSLVRHQLGLPFTGSTNPRLFYVADVEMTFEAAEPETLYIPLGESAFVLMAPMQGHNHWRLIGNLPHAEAEPVFEDLIPQIKDLVQSPLEITHLRWFSTYRVHTRHADDFALGRCFLVGDAAHVHTPAGGQGMNTGIQDAYNLAWKLWWVLRHQGQTSLLDSYNQERLANAQSLLRSTDQAFHVIAGDQHWTRFLRSQILPALAHVLTQFGPARELVFPLLSQTGIHYRESMLSQSSDLKLSVKAGDRLPYFEIAAGDIYEHLKHPCFYLLVFDDGQQPLGSLLQASESAYAKIMDVITVPLYPYLVKRFQSSQAFYLLLRPDLHIALSARADSLEPVHQYFDRWSLN